MYQNLTFYNENQYAITDFKLRSRYLWNDHISYTRNAIISLIAELPDVDAVSARLMKNQEDIGTFISPYYSVDQVSALVDLLKQHIAIAADVVNGVEGAKLKWEMNGNDVVNYMSQMNRMFWPVSVTKPLWTSHMDLTIAEIDARKQKNWTTDITSYDSGHAVISDFADIFASGIIYQNIDMFCFDLTR